MLSGLKPVLVAWASLVVIAWLLTPSLYSLIAHWLSGFFDGRGGVEDYPDALPGANTKPRAYGRNPIRTWTTLLGIGILGLWIIRPSVPYGHMSGTLPLVLLQVFIPQPSVPRHFHAQQFPFPKLLEQQYWEAPQGHFPGWAPDATLQPSASGPYPRARPWWTAGELPAGFGRFGRLPGLDDSNGQESENSSNIYNPVTDPLKISNADLKVLEPLEKALQDHDIPITHIVLVLMESARKDVFPFKAGSLLHEKILASRDTTDSNVIQDVNEKLANMTPIAEKLTGQSSGFSAEDTERNHDEPELGGINVEGVLTGSSLSFKSAVMHYCGVQPLPVNFMEEATSKIYQPCIMQILALFNQLKDGSASDSMHERRWKSIFLQSITGRYDSQDALNAKMGFNETVNKETLIDSKSKYYHLGMAKINYFGWVSQSPLTCVCNITNIGGNRYPEPELFPYIQDAVNDAVENKTRLFLSHFTSTTHHPWGTPKGFHYEDYYPTQGARAKYHEDMNSYLNAVRYVDTWLGNVMDLLNEKGIANETLVVLVGDHGQAFSEDAPVSGTYQNTHLSNFHIPLTFHHPLLPRMQITANTTSLSILPTILDLLVQTRSLNDKDADVASDLMNEYEGQSLIRPYKDTHNGRQAWNFNLINPGGEILSVGSAAVAYRLILPLTDDFEYKFTNPAEDPEENASITEWEEEMLVEHVRRVHGDHAAQWTAEAEQVGRWWVAERMRLWNQQET